MDESGMRESLKRLMRIIIDLKDRQLKLENQILEYKSAASFVRDLAIAEGWNPPLNYVPPNWTASDLEEFWRVEHEENGSKPK